MEEVRIELRNSRDRQVGSVQAQQGDASHWLDRWTAINIVETALGLYQGVGPD